MARPLSPRRRRGSRRWLRRLGRLVMPQLWELHPGTPDVHLLECSRSPGRVETRDCGTLPPGMGRDSSASTRDYSGGMWFSGLECGGTWTFGGLYCSRSGWQIRRRTHGLEWDPLRQGRPSGWATCCSSSAVLAHWWLAVGGGLRLRPLLPCPLERAVGIHPGDCRQLPRDSTAVWRGLQCHIGRRGLAEQPRGPGPRVRAILGLHENEWFAGDGAF